MTFRAWLREQRDRDDPVGDLAQDALADRGWRGNSVASLADRMTWIACSEARAALREAAEEYGEPLPEPEETEGCAGERSGGPPRGATPKVRGIAELRLEAAAKERQREHGGTSPGRKSLSANLREVTGKSAGEAAALVNVSPRSVEAAATDRVPLGDSPVRGCPICRTPVAAGAVCPRCCHV